ncbi:MAG: hypothetical protein HQ508_06130 [Candidatus Marinimicrobia bacterium]|nr:hypothetical protein [Candidatus Neomarinimicrobiota bacterium]
MKTTRNHGFFLVIIAISLGIMGCESMTPTSNAPEAEILSQGISADQLNFVEWTPEVIQALRAVSDELDSDVLARGEYSIAGAEVKKALHYRNTTIGGDNTFGNSVFIPSGAISENTYIGVQAVCAESDELAIFENGVSYINEIKSSMTTLIADLASDEYAAEIVAISLDQIEEAEVYFQLYSYYASPNAFRKLDRNVCEQMNTLIWMIDHNDLNESFFGQIQSIVQLTVAAARELAMTSIMYAEQVPGAVQHKINRAYEEIDEGDEEASDPSDEYDLEWYNYDAAIRNYCYAWKKATQAIHNLEAPCGASVDFLPSQQFQANVTVTLSWEALNFDGNPEGLEVYWYQEDTDLWVLVPDPVIDYDLGTVSVNIDHFTRYAWVNSLPPSED